MVLDEADAGAFVLDLGEVAPAAVGAVTPVGRNDGDTANVVGFGEPHRAVRPGRDAPGAALGCRDRELGDRAAGGDPVDLVDERVVADEPELAVRSGCDRERASGGCWDRELPDPAVHGDPTVLVPVALGERQLPLRPW